MILSEERKMDTHQLTKVGNCGIKDLPFKLVWGVMVPFLMKIRRKAQEVIQLRHDLKCGVQKHNGLWFSPPTTSGRHSLLREMLWFPREHRSTGDDGAEPGSTCVEKRRFRPG